MKQNPIKEKSFAFAVRMVKLSQYLNEEKREFVIAKQLLRSGTSIGANVRESQNAESPADFIHKLHIAQKEADETRYWIEILEATWYITSEEFTSLESDIVQILNLLCSIIKTKKSNL